MQRDGHHDQRPRIKPAPDFNKEAADDRLLGVGSVPGCRHDILTTEKLPFDSVPWWSLGDMLVVARGLLVVSRWCFFCSGGLLVTASGPLVPWWSLGGMLVVVRGLLVFSRCYCFVCWFARDC